MTSIISSMMRGRSDRNASTMLRRHPGQLGQLQARARSRAATAARGSASTSVPAPGQPLQRQEREQAQHVRVEHDRDHRVGHQVERRRRRPPRGRCQRSRTNSISGEASSIVMIPYWVSLQHPGHVQQRLRQVGAAADHGARQGGAVDPARARRSGASPTRRGSRSRPRRSARTAAPSRRPRWDAVERHDARPTVGSTHSASRNASRSWSTLP